MPTHTNRLADSTSPYLLQHAHNPVDWYPWGEEAFEAARERNVPIFLSIGYSTCYWCHVMERESFENEAMARVMNERFVCIKLDREERPDLDDIYMAATQTMTGRGGWPMSVFLEPESLKPFYCGTYFPAEPRPGLPGFEQVLVAMSEAWSERTDDVRTQADAVADAVIEQLASREQPVVVGANEVQQGVGTLLQIADMQLGGFGQAPKFPQPAYIDFLLDVRGSADAQSRQAIDAAVRLTLDRMLIGGIHDQIGGGFHRYSVDESWTVPHFEKMLYDNGQLAATYARAAGVYDDAQYARVAVRAAEYVLREMTSPDGGFYSAQDAEVDGREGLNYLWTPEQIADVLNEDDAAFANERFGLASGTNFQDPHHTDEPALNVLRLGSRPDNDAERIDAIAAQLLAARDARKQPRLDDKIIAGWNGIMIRGMAETAMLTGESRYLDAAARAAAFIERAMITESEGLLRTHRAGRSHTPAFLDDHASMVIGLATLARAQDAAGVSAERTLSLATRIADDAIASFGDAQTGAFFDTREGETDLFVRGRSTYDGAIPSGVSTMINGLLDLAAQGAGATYARRATQAIVAHSASIEQSPIATVHSTRALFRAMQAGLPLDEVFAQADARQPDRAQEVAAPDPVEIYADTERVSVSADAPAELSVIVRVKPGYHILAAQPGEHAEGLVPLRITVAGGTGVAVYADYPEGAPYTVGGLEGEILVHEGDVELTVVLDRHGERTGRAVLVVSYQACTDTECLAPRAVELDVAIDID